MGTHYQLWRVRIYMRSEKVRERKEEMRTFNYYGRDQEKKSADHTNCPVCCPYLCYLSIETTWAKSQALDCSPGPAGSITQPVGVNIETSSNGPSPQDRSGPVPTSLSPGVTLMFPLYLFSPGSASGLYRLPFQAA